MTLATNDILQHDAVRNSILETARELFSKFGYKKTTLDDIANVHGKGKSSLYYYFKNKEDIFQAVIELEEQILFSSLKFVVDAKLTSENKLREYVNVRMNTILTLDNYYKALQQDQGGLYDFLEIVRSKNAQQEVALMRSIIDEGISNNSFQVKNADMASFALVTALKGLEVPLLSTKMSKDEMKNQIDNILNILFFGIIKR